jgi:hypothetical protein
VVSVAIFPNKLAIAVVLALLEATLITVAAGVCDAAVAVE